MSALLNIFARKPRFEDKKIEKKAKKLPPYEKREKVSSLSVFFTIINRNQSDYFIDEYYKAGASISIVLYSRSMPPEEVIQLLGTISTKKEIIMTICRSEIVSELSSIAKNRFLISPASKGIAFACPIDAVSGIAIYKYLSDANKLEREREEANNA